MKAPLHEFYLVALLLGVAGMMAVEAKGSGGPIRGMVMFRPLGAVVLAHEIPGEEAMIVDKSYFGTFNKGERVQVEPESFKDELTVPGSGMQPEVFLVLTKAEINIDQHSFYGRLLFAKGLVIDDTLSRRISDGRIYFWAASTKTAGYSFWRWITDTASLSRDKSHPDLASLESDLTEGLSRHDEWTRAQVATDPVEKLRLLRSFLLPGGPHKLSPYEFWSCAGSAMEQAEKAGPTSVPFFEELLTEPAYQDDFSPDNWGGLGAQERAQLLKSLAIVEAQNADTPQEKLAMLRTVFDVPTFATDAGLDGVGVLREYFDRALALAMSLNETNARPFLQKLLTLPQFQEGYSPIGETSWGHEFRQKIETALTALH